MARGPQRLALSLHPGPGHMHGQGLAGALISPEPLDPNCMLDPKPRDGSGQGVPVWDRAKPGEAAWPPALTPSNLAALPLRQPLRPSKRPCQFQKSW